MKQTCHAVTTLLTPSPKGNGVRVQPKLFHRQATLQEGQKSTPGNILVATFALYNSLISTKKTFWTLNTTIISALSRTYMVSGAANSCCADICWGNNLVSRLWLGFFAWKATTLALIHLWRAPLLSLHKSKEKTTQIFSLALANSHSPRRGSERLWGSIGSAPDCRWNPGGRFAGALK